MLHAHHSQREIIQWVFLGCIKCWLQVLYVARSTFTKGDKCFGVLREVWDLTSICCTGVIVKLFVTKSDEIFGNFENNQKLYDDFIRVKYLTIS